MESAKNDRAKEHTHYEGKLWIKRDLNESYNYLKALSNEARLYLLFLTTLLAFSLVYIWQESSDDDVDTTKRNRSLGQGWMIMSRKADIADFEWTFWFSEARYTLISIYIGHVMVGWFTSLLLPQQRDNALFTFGVLCVFLLLGGIFVAFITAICVAYYLIAKQQSVAYVLLLTSALLLSIANLPYMQYIVSSTYYPILAHSGLTYAIFRCSSFAMEMIRNPSLVHNTLWTLHQYNFYIPYFFFGPVMTFHSFIGERTLSSRSSVLSTVLPDLIKVTVYAIIIDFLRHFFHVSSLPLDSEFMQNAPFIVIGFLGFINFYLDWIKGRVLYSVASGTSKHVDGYTDTPGGCKNVARIYTFADTYFDRGIQHWLCRYVYDPLGNGHMNTKNEAIAGGAAFLMVILLQGICWQTVTWAFFNWFGLTMEFYLMQNFQETVNKRILALLLGLNYWCIILFNCIGINGVAAFGLYFNRLFIESGIIGSAIIALIGYCYVFVNMELNQKIKTE